MPDRSVSVESGGQTFNGSFREERGMVYVSSAYGSKTTQRGGSPAETVAKMLLRELVDEWRRER